MGLDVTIVGAGLAGAIAARVMREKHNVTIIERFSGGHEVGAAINLGPTAVKIIDNLGFDRKRAGSVVANSVRSLDKAGKLLQTNDMTKFACISQADWLFQHRADLWSEFVRLATAPSATLGISGQPAKVLWGSEVVSVDVESGDVVLADGGKIGSDLIIGADGIRSVVRPLVVGQADFASARSSGSSAFRFTLTAEQVRAVHGDIDLLDSSTPAKLDIYLALDQTNRSIVMYPARSFEVVNFVCIVSDNIIGRETEESWSAEGSRADLLRCFDDFCPYVKDLLSHAKNVKLWQLRDQDPLPTYVKGRTLLIGDAAHAMTPHQGQGGTQSVEDAEALRLFDDSSVTRDSIFAALQNFDKVRRTRASQIQNNTRESHERKDPERMFKHNLYNWTYPGVQGCLSNLEAGREMVVLS